MSKAKLKVEIKNLSTKHHLDEVMKKALREELPILKIGNNLQVLSI